MLRLPAFDPQKQINHSPHVVILGAGASRASFPSGDAQNKRLPLLVELPDCLDLRTAITDAGFRAVILFERQMSKQPSGELVESCASSGF